MMNSSHRSTLHRLSPRRARSRGATTVEYAALVGIVVALALGAWQFLGHRIKCALGFASAQISADGYGHGSCGKAASHGPVTTDQPGGPIAAP